MGSAGSDGVRVIDWIYRQLSISAPKRQELFFFLLISRFVPSLILI